MNQVSEKERKAYEVVRQGVGGLFLSFERCLKMTGKDRLAYLHGLVTNDVKGLKVGEGCYAACLIPEGRMVSDLRIYVLEDALLLFFKQSARERLMTHLDHYLFAEDVQMSLLQDETLSLLGPRSRSFLSEISGQTVMDRPECHQEITVAEIRLRGFRHSHTGQEGYDLLVPSDVADTVKQFVSEKGKTFGFEWITEETFHRFRIEAGIPFFGIDMTESTIPIEAGLEKSAVSYTKGCYTGQEVIAKIKYIGHVNRYLIGLKGREDVFQPGSKVLFQGQEVGSVTSATFSFLLNCPIALGTVKREFKKPGSVVEVVAGTNRVPAELHDLPFGVP